MRKHYWVLLVGIFWASVSTAQDIQEGMATMSQGSQNGFVVGIPAIDAKSAVDVWKKLMKNYKGKTKYDGKTNEIFTDDAMIDGLSDNTVDVYARVIEEGSKAAGMAVWFDLGGAYLTSDKHVEGVLQARRLLSNYYVGVENALAENALASEEKKYKNLEKEIKSLDKKISKLEKNIDKANKVIKKAEKDIKQFEDERELLTAELQEQKAAVKAAEAPLKTKKNR